MPTVLPVRRRKPADLSVIHLAMVPLSAMFLSTILQGEMISVPALLRALLAGADAIAEAELGFGRGWVMTPI